MMKVAALVTIGNGNEAYCSCEEDADRDTMVVALMVRKTMMAVLMVINIVMVMMGVRTYVVTTYVRAYSDYGDEDGDVDCGYVRK